MNREEMRAAMQAKPFEIVPVTVKGWGQVFVREMFPKEGDKYIAAREAQKALGADGIPDTVVLAACVMCDELGELVYDVSSQDDLTALSKISMNKLSKVVAAANALGADETGN